MEINRVGYNLWEDEILKEKGIVDILKGVSSGKILEIPPFRYDVISGDSMKNIFFSGKAFPYLDERGSPSGIIVMIEDVTKKLKLEEEYLETKKIDYLLFPKATVDSLNILDEYLSDLERTLDLERVEVIALVESAKSIVQVNKIACHNRVKGILLGAEDLCNDLEIDRTNDGMEILFARSRVIYACANNNIISIDTPNTNTQNDDLLKRDCINAKSLGMKAKTAIHPSQLEIINDVFSPSKKEIDWANQVLEAVEKNKGKGAFSLNGKMIDKPIILKAKKIIERSIKYNK